MGDRPTLQDVARAARVSTATVSRVLNTPGQVRVETRARVEAAIARLGYLPHFGGRALALNRTNTVGVVIPTMANAIFARGLQALQETLAEAEINLLIATSGYDVAREAEQIRTLLSRSVDGIVLIGEARPRESYDLLNSHGTPFVILWTWRADSPYICVGFDNRAAARAMAEHVISAGHRRIAMISGLTESNDRAQLRLEGVRDALHLHGLALDGAHLAETPYGLDQGAEAAAHLLMLPQRPTAILCGNDVLAAGAIEGARRAGFVVPADVSIVGFDDVELARVAQPPLTTVHVPHRRMGHEGARVLLEMISDQGPGHSVELETEIVDRASLGRLPQPQSA
ncbi:LacI family DNA-binding transcriptional regulator [Dichotomicrobium thermohalophilum]|uniref:LacI family transcriptional regulator n=1 Tax=Dichotomicrobium thermohalophilum TaxID=933063 RepID=A0A397PE67_9HYPH|nr:LacI family DNA-binding transcriptional regulator [Dichotomicrobium thermohalophilum]RIA47258.1 LacI family transcriptional regulator [Dichotomicrobium thermohalophilum]